MNRFICDPILKIAVNKIEFLLITLWKTADNTKRFNGAIKLGLLVQIKPREKLCDLNKTAQLGDNANRVYNGTVHNNWGV